MRDIVKRTAGSSSSVNLLRRDAENVQPILLTTQRSAGTSHGVCNVRASAGRMHAAVGRQGSSSKPAFHEGSVWSSYRLRGVLSEAWSRGCARV